MIFASININPSEISFIDYLQLILSFVTTLFAFFALVTWRKEKVFDSQVELLSNSHIAEEYIDLIRSPLHLGDGVSISKTIKGLANSSKEKIYVEHDKLIQESKKEALITLEHKLTELKAKAWGMFGDKSPFFKFYDYALNAGSHLEAVRYSLHFEYSQIENHNSGMRILSADQLKTSKEHIELFSKTLKLKYSDTDKIQDELNKRMIDIIKVRPKRFII